MGEVYFYTKIQTTGGPNHDLVEIGAVAEINGKAVLNFQRHIWPIEHITRRTASMHGIQMVR